MKRITTIGTAVVAVLTVSSCGGGSNDESISFEQLTTQKTVSIAKNEGAPTCNVQLELACAKESQGERAKAINAVVAQQLLGLEGLSLKQAADSFANSYTRSYVQDFGPLYREDQADAEKRSWYEYHYNISSETRQGRKGTTVYTAIVDYYEGGAHGINQRLVMNFDNKTGKLLTLGDVFVPGFEGRLNEMLLEALIEKTGSKDVNDLRDKGYLYLMDIFAPENFALDEKSMTFTYNPYEIAPYAMGMTELELPYDELEDIMRK